MAGSPTCDAAARRFQFSSRWAEPRKRHRQMKLEFAVQHGQEQLGEEVWRLTWLR